MYVVYKLMATNRSFDQLPSPSPLLPNEIASRIIDLELDYESKVLTKDHLLELLRLYSQAIQFYQQNNDKKHFIFQQRLSTVLKNPYSISILSEQSANKIKEKQISELTKTAQYGSGQEAHQLLSTFLNQKSKVATKIIREIEGQKSKIIRRLMNKSFTKSFVTAAETKCSQGDTIDLMETEKQWRLEKEEESERDKEVLKDKEREREREKEMLYGERLGESKLKQDNKIVKVQNDFLSFVDSNGTYKSPEKKSNARIINL